MKSFDHNITKLPLYVSNSPTKQATFLEDKTVIVINFNLHCTCFLLTAATAFCAVWRSRNKTKATPLLSRVFLSLRMVTLWKAKDEYQTICPKNNISPRRLWLKVGRGRGTWDVGTSGRGDVGTWGLGDVGTWGRGDSGTRGRVNSGMWGRGDTFSKYRISEMGQHRQESWIACVILLFKYQLNTQQNSKIGFSKSHSHHPSQSSNVKQSRRPNGPLLTLQLKFHVAAFVVVVAQKLEPYDSFSVLNWSLNTVQVSLLAALWLHLSWLLFNLLPLIRVVTVDVVENVRHLRARSPPGGGGGYCHIWAI